MIFSFTSLHLNGVARAIFPWHLDLMCTTKRKSQCTPAKGDANQTPGHAKPYIQDQGISQSVIHLLRYWGGVLYRWRLALAEDQETFVPSPLCTANLVAIIFRGQGSLLTPGKQWCRISGQASLRLRSSTSEICSQPRSWVKKCLKVRQKLGTRKNLKI